MLKRSKLKARLASGGGRHAKDGGRGFVREIVALPTELRDVFVLNRMTGMTYDEISSHLGIDPEAVQTRLAAALVRLTSGRGAGLH